MASIFTTIPGKTIKGFAGKEYPVPMYLQFVPGIVVEVVHSEESLRYSGPNTINTIIAKPHITEKSFKRKSTLGEKERYYPLLRTMNDVPSDGDPVLLCTIGKINYYLGPINTTVNSPTWNDDPSYIPELPIAEPSDTLPGNSTTQKGQTENFNKEILYSRLTKYRKEDLDYGNAIAKTTGDTIFEGRHGNSIRIGSRSNNPYIFISNERFPTNDIESINDGSLISITSNGTIQQHLAGGIDSDGVDIDESQNASNVNFQLSSDTVENNSYPIGDIYTDLNNDVDIQEAIYGYSGNQMLLHSDRITLNSKLDDIFVSSIKDIHIGAGRHISIGSFNTLNLMSSEVLIGNSNRASDMQPMVLGEALLDILERIVSLFDEVQSVPQTGGKLIPSPNQALIKNDLEQILSNFHKIEGND